MQYIVFFWHRDSGSKNSTSINDRGDVAAATTVLSITTLGFVGRAALPKVNYPTALDWFVILCFGTVFAVLVEYAVINFIDKVRVDIQRLLEERKKQKELREALKVMCQLNWK